jgi:UDP-N-acetylglucosamine--N-acetylmuramyl-(pentapeptide) pyrophosphoryl-undecaprenol N-acetylglucosamine transferase
VLAARSLGCKTFLHESNTIPGRANRLLARWVDQAFVGFPETEGRLPAREVAVTGTPVRLDFHAREAALCRQELELEAGRPVLLVMGGSQGASGINQAILRTLPVLARQSLQWQWLHLTGPKDADKVRAAYAAHGLKAVVQPFSTRMDLALGAATACVSRAGASSLAELAAMQLPAILIPFPAAADNHQWHNARAFEQTGAAWLLPEAEATPDRVAEALRDLMDQPTERALMKAALAQWHAPQAARLIADRMWQALGRVSQSPAPDLISPLPEHASGTRARVGGVTVA